MAGTQEDRSTKTLWSYPGLNLGCLCGRQVLYPLRYVPRITLSYAIEVFQDSQTFSVRLLGWQSPRTTPNMAVQRCWFMSASRSPTMLAPFRCEACPVAEGDDAPDVATADIFLDLFRPPLPGSLIVNSFAVQLITFQGPGFESRPLAFSFGSEGQFHFKDTFISLFRFKQASKWINGKVTSAIFIRKTDNSSALRGPISSEHHLLLVD